MLPATGVIGISVPGRREPLAEPLAQPDLPVNVLDLLVDGPAHVGVLGPQGPDRVR